MPEVRDRHKVLKGWRGAGDEAHLTLTADQFRAVRSHHEKEAVKRRAVEQTVRVWAHDTGATIVGLNADGSINHSVKELESLCRKVAGDLRGSSSTSKATDIVRGMKDIHRFTYLWNEQNYVNGVNGIFQNADKGKLETIKKKHTWNLPTFKGFNSVLGRFTPSPNGSPSWSVGSIDSLKVAQEARKKDQEDINYGIFRNKDGVKFEIQAHTFASKEVNDQTHSIYEAQRVAPKEYAPAFDYMRYRAYIDAGVKTPANIEALPGDAGSKSPPPLPPRDLYDYAAVLVEQRHGAVRPYHEVATLDATESMSSLSLGNAIPSLAPSPLTFGAQPSFAGQSFTMSGLATMVADRYPSSIPDSQSYATGGNGYGDSYLTPAPRPLVNPATVYMGGYGAPTSPPQSNSSLQSMHPYSQYTAGPYAGGAQQPRYAPSGPSVEQAPQYKVVKKRGSTR